MTGSYDPETNLTFWGVGNPGPDYNAETRPGDNLYSCSVIALDADTGKLKWHYQFTPDDEFDWDAVQIPVLADISWKGSPRKAMLWANRNGFFYVLDRRTGEFLQATPIAKQNWNAGFDNGTADSHAELDAPAATACSSIRAIRAPPTGSIRRSARAPGCSTSTSGRTRTTFLPAPISNTRKAPAYTQGRLSTNYPGRGIAAGMRACSGPISGRKRRTSGPFGPSIPRPASGNGNTR